MRWHALACALIAVGGCADAPSTSGDASHDVFPARDVLFSKRISRPECERLANAVWVEVSPAPACIRYFPSAQVAGSRRVAFWLSGDRLKGRSTVENYEDNSVEKQTALADLFAQRTGMPWIVIARPGLYGSSGDHNDRRTLKEIAQVDAALTAIRLRLNVDRIVVAGQSGGGGLVGALLTRGRSDIDCAVSSSGALSVKARNASLPGGRDPTGNVDLYDPIEHVAGIRPDPRRRTFVVGDRRDQNMPFVAQRQFADAAAARGEQVTVIESTAAAGSEHHGLMNLSFRVAGWCAAGLPTDEVARRGTAWQPVARGST
jgi:dienelactone hydrolase